MKVRHLIAMTAALAVSSNVLAADGEALFEKNRCGSCHALDKKSVGPALKEIAAKYTKVQGAQATLETKVRSGGSGSFGAMPMPATPTKTVSNGDIKAMVAWILSQK